jgi:hypothetical protein
MRRAAERPPNLLIGNLLILAQLDEQDGALAHLRSLRPITAAIQ